MAMKEIQNGKERDADDWAAVFHMADARFVLKEIRQPEGSDLALIVVEWAPGRGGETLATAEAVTADETPAADTISTVDDGLPTAETENGRDG